MNSLECLLITEKVLNKLFGIENVKQVLFNPSKNNKISFTVLIDTIKYAGFLYYHSKLTAKDIKNILFAFKRTALKSLDRNKNDLRI